MTLQPLVSEFTVVGKLENFVISSKGRIKQLSLSTPQEDYSIEVAKSSSNLSQHLKPGCRLKITGMRKYKLHQAEVEYKAYSIELLSEQLPAKAIADKIRGKVLVCQGSSCSKKGGQTVGKILQAELKAQGLSDRVVIKTTGCMKQCKQAPYIVMPGRKPYSRVQPRQVRQLVSNLR